MKEGERDREGGREEGREECEGGRRESEVRCTWPLSRAAQGIADGGE